MKVLSLIGACVLVATLSFPLSAGAFGRAPSSSEVHPTGTVHITTHHTTTSHTETTDSNGEPGTPHAVPEPPFSTFFLAVAIGLVTVVWLKKRFDQASEQ